jgi:hypothetical protein
MKRILCSVLVATLAFGSVLADARKSKNAMVTLVYQHELPNVPGKSIKGVLVEYAPGGHSPGHTDAEDLVAARLHPKLGLVSFSALLGGVRPPTWPEPPSPERAHAATYRRIGATPA